MFNIFIINNILLYILKIFINIYICYKRNIILYPNGNDDENFVSVYLRNQDVKHNDSLQIPIKYVFFVRRYDDYYYNYNCKYIYIYIYLSIYLSIFIYMIFLYKFSLFYLIFLFI